MKTKYFFSFKLYRFLLKSILTPGEMYDQVEDINLDQLEKKGYKTILLDLDNTLLAYSERNLSLEKSTWVETLKSYGFNVFLVSNNSSRKRVERAARSMQLEGLFFALKPFPFSVREFAYKNYIDLEKTVVIGDQLFTDIILGNWIKAHSILVDPLDKPKSFLRTMQRELERYLLNKLEVIPQ